MLSRKIYISFLKSVVRNGVFSEDELARESVPLGDETMKKIRSGKRLDHRIPYLARVSGKGGLDARGVRHDSVRNVSLLEHVTSVARGALVLGEQDLRAAGAEPDESALAARLARVTAVGFLHDADKMIGREREMLGADAIEQLMQRYCVDSFLADWKASASSEWTLAMIDQAEVSRAGRLSPGGVMLSLADRADAAYVRCADRVEGKFLAHGPRAAVDELDAFEGFCTPSALRERWRIVDIYQPHIPFVLEALHIGFASGCEELAGVPPLIETHQDGRLIAILPRDLFDAIREHALAEVARRFRAVTRVSVNTRWALDLHDARATVDDLRDAVSDEGVKTRLLPVASAHASEGAEIRILVDDTFGELGFSVAWPPADRVTGAMIRLQPRREDSRHGAVFAKARMLATGLRCKPPGDTALARATPEPNEREATLLDVLDAHGADVPRAIRRLDDAITRRSLLALVAGGACESDAALDDAVFGHAGLLERWLDGADGSAGLNARLPNDAAAQYVEPVRDMLAQAIDGRFVPAAEDAPRRCHFTNTPVEESARLKSTVEGIYALGPSAFSGREGRPESHRSTRSGTYLSPLARTEHALRFRDNPRQRDGKNVSFLLSSPSVTGLFASLPLGSDTDITEVSTYDLRVRDPAKVKTAFSAFDSFERRILVGRYEAHETGLNDSLDMVLRIVEASLRTGRSIHVFQGAPHEVHDRVYFDALPHEIQRGLGGNGFRIEEIETVRDQLQTWHQVCSTNGLGVSAATAMMDPDTRLAALCEAVDQIDRSDSNAHPSLRFTLLNQAQGLIMTDQTASPIVRFARAMTGYQSGPHRESSQADRTRGMRLALEALDSVSIAGTTDRETMICAVVAEIENAALRETDKQFTARRDGDPTHREALNRAAEIFADEVWRDVFRSRPPDSKARRSAIGIYRVAFERAHQLRKDGQTVFPS